MYYYHYDSPFGSRILKFRFSVPQDEYEYVYGPEESMINGHVLYSSYYITPHEFLASTIYSDDEYIQPVGYNYRINKKDSYEYWTDKKFYDVLEKSKGI